MKAHVFAYGLIVVLMGCGRRPDPTAGLRALETWETNHPTKRGGFVLAKLEADKAWTNDPGFFPTYIISYEACREFKDMKLGTTARSQ